MFTDEQHGGDDRIRRSGSLWGLHSSTRQYRAWRYWQQLEFNKRFFPEWITVTNEWPPTTQVGAELFANWFSEIRDDIGGCALVPRHPCPWNGYTPTAGELQSYGEVDDTPSAMPEGATPPPGPPVQEQLPLPSSARDATDAKELIGALAKRMRTGPVR